MAGTYTKELKWHTITVLENLWDIRSVSASIMFLDNKVHNFSVLRGKSLYLQFRVNF